MNECSFMRFKLFNSCSVYLFVVFVHLSWKKPRGLSQKRIKCWTLAVSFYQLCTDKSAWKHCGRAWALEAAWMSTPNKLINFIITLHKIYFDRWSNNSSRNLIASTIYGIRGCCNAIMYNHWDWVLFLILYLIQVIINNYM